MLVVPLAIKIVANKALWAATTATRYCKLVVGPVDSSPNESVLLLVFAAAVRSHCQLQSAEIYNKLRSDIKTKQ